MNTTRRWHVLVLLALVIDLVNPVMPGVFSLAHGSLFMDVVTRANGSAAPAGCLRACPRARTVVAAGAIEPTGRLHAAVRGTRRAHEHPDPRRALDVASAPPSADSEDN